MKTETAGARIGCALDELASALELRGVDQARLVAEHLLAHVVHCARLELYGRFDQVLTAAETGLLHSLAARAAEGEPLQYLFGEADFMGCLLKIDRRAFIPRPETELLVETVLRCTELWRQPRPRIADIGAGCGCIAIALARERPEAEYTGIDLSDDALALARENARRCGLTDHIRWAKCDLLEDSPPKGLDAIVANLPYVPSEQCRNLPGNVRCFEPMMALDGGPDGLSLIWRLVKQAPDALKSGGWLFLETGEEQASVVMRRMESEGWRKAKVTKDLSGRDRIVSGVRP